MMWGGQITATRRAKPSHEPWVPLPYMARAVDHLVNNSVAVLPLQPSGRKTSITLAAFKRLKDAGLARTMLVIAPLRACRLVWRQEGQKWSEFRDLKFSFLHGPKKADRLRDDADIWLINPAGVAWLCQHFNMRQLPFDIVAIDELTAFQNPQAERSKALRKRTERVPRKWGLTGSFAAKGYMGVFGEMLVLDGGAALGKYITHYRDQYFQVDYNGFDYELMPGGAKRIEEKLAPYMFYMDEKDYAQLPPVVDNIIDLEMEPKERAIYDRMKKEMVAELPGGVITAANKAACYSKLAQMANGAVYIDKATHKVEHLHDLKLDAIAELVEELNGVPLMVAYEFQHDLWRLRERFGKDLPYLGSGTTPAQEETWVNAWNANKLPIFAIHPASAGHALNLHEGGAMHLAWFGVTWDWELYDQLIRRIRRGGSKATQIFNHLLKVRDTMDELKMDALRDKDMTERRMMGGINKLLLNAIQTHADGESARHDTRTPMTVAKLSRQPAAATPQAETGEVRRIVPKGWGVKAATPPTETQTPEAEAVAQSGEAAQRERIQAKLRGEGETTHTAFPRVEPTEAPTRPTPAELARAAFSPAVRQQMAEMEAELPPIMGDHTVRIGEQNHPAPRIPTTITPAQTDIEDVAPTGQRPAETTAGGDSKPDRPRTTRAGRRAPAASVEPDVTVTPDVRLAVLQLAFNRAANSAEAFELAHEMWDFVTAA